MESSRSLLFFSIIGTSLLMGCGGSGDRPKLATVTGTVFMDEKQVPNIWVMFNPTGGGRTSVARTNNDGLYELQYLEKVKGANIGSHKVVIMSYNDDELEEMRAATNKAVKEPIPSKYNSKSTLTEEVKAGKNVIDFHLESK